MRATKQPAGKESAATAPRGRGGAEVGFGRGRGRRGDVRAAILTLLDIAPAHGYQLIEEISERSGGLWQPRAGSVYPALQLLEDEQLVRAEQAEGRRVYHLTDAGRTHVDDHRTELDSAWAGVTEAVHAPVRELRELYEQLGFALKHVVHTGTESQIDEARALLAGTRRQLYRILADEPDAGSGGNR